MNPPGGNNHSVALAEVNLGDLVDHVAKPRMTLYLASGPAFVCGKISGRGAYEEEGLENININKLDDDIGEINLRSPENMVIDG
jgi:hypothetical protein